MERTAESGIQYSPGFRVTASGLRNSRSINLSAEVNILSEGVNNKISILQRQAYDHHNEDCLIPKIIAAFLSPLSRNAEDDPHYSA
ncbi:MAG TPA: hypothetical protein ENG96_00530 [Gammaproteobacteria bacterium]|nr:hypothetical protein [Gammaproteobacteria bacterium]